MHTVAASCKLLFVCANEWMVLRWGVTKTTRLKSCNGQWFNFNKHTNTFQHDHTHTHTTPYFSVFACLFWRVLKKQQQHLILMRNIHKNYVYIFFAIIQVLCFFLSFQFNLQTSQLMYDVEWIIEIDLFTIGKMKTQ